MSLSKEKLPKGWAFIHGAYYYRVPKAQRHHWDDKTKFRLGKTLSEAWRTWFLRLGDDGNDDVVTMDDLFTEWYREYVMLELAEGTQANVVHYLKPLRRAFGHMLPAEIRPVHAYQYRAKRQKTSPSSANAEVSYLSSALGYGVTKGYVEMNPLKGQISRTGKAKAKPRDRVPSLDELAHFVRVNPEWRGYIALKRMTGLRKSQLIGLDLSKHYKDGVLHPIRLKGGRDTQYTGEDLAPMIEAILYERHGTDALPKGHLFTNSKGKPWTLSAFNSAWRRARTKYMADGGEHFVEHDIRRTAANLADSLEEAQLLLGHTSSRVTQKVYRIGPERVRV